LRARRNKLHPGSPCNQREAYPLDAEADAYYYLVTEFDGTVCETLANRRLLLRGFAVINRHGEWCSRYSTQDIGEAMTLNSRTGLRVARLGSLFYFAWGLLHVGVAHDIYLLRVVQSGITQGRIFQLSAYLLSIAAFAICVAAAGNWRNSRVAFWLNLCVVECADSVWVFVVVLPGYVPLARGLIPPAIFLATAMLTTVARKSIATDA
jgi:hypothetical protein